MGKTTRQEQLTVIFIIILYIAFVIIRQWPVFSISYSIPEYEAMYSQSQYVKGDNHTRQMGDGEIYAYAGIRYVQGEDVTKINFEHTPLMKYAYGASYLLTGRPNWALLPLMFISMYVYWLLSAEVIASFRFRLLALAGLMLHTAWSNNLTQTMLDFPLATMVLITVYAYVKLALRKNLAWTIVFGAVSGFMLAVKYPVPVTLLLLICLYLALFLRLRQIKPLLSSALIAGGTYLFTCLSFFLHGNSPVQFLKFEWWRWQWFQGKTDSTKFMLLQTLFTGRYPKWWDNSGYVYLSQWNLYWPVNFILYLASWITKRTKNFDVLFPYKVWIMLAFSIYLLGAAEDRFLVPLIPGFTLYACQFLELSFNRLKSSRREIIRA